MSDLTDRVAFCVVKANCNGPSFMVAADKDMKRDHWACRHCGATTSVGKGEVPTRPRRTEYGSR